MKKHTAKIKQKSDVFFGGGAAVSDPINTNEEILKGNKTGMGWRVSNKRSEMYC
jgi:hypothetical protein